MKQKELFYYGLNLEEDEEFCMIMQELNEDPRALILKEPEQVLIHHMKGAPECIRWGENRDTGESHVGYARHYVRFAYGGYIFYVEPSPYYPFADENHPGRFNFNVYKRVGSACMEQCSYCEKYEGFHSVLGWLAHSSPRKIKGAPLKRIDINITEGCVSQIIRIVSLRGGIREKEILRANPLFLSSETWNDEHKVVRVISGQSSSDGHRDSFEFDSVTFQICG